MQKKLSWQAFSNDDRNKVIEAVKNRMSIVMDVLRISICSPILH